MLKLKMLTTVVLLGVLFGEKVSPLLHTAKKTWTNPDYAVWHIDATWMHLGMLTGPLVAYHERASIACSGSTCSQRFESGLQFVGLQNFACGWLDSAVCPQAEHVHSVCGMHPRYLSRKLYHLCNVHWWLEEALFENGSYPLVQASNSKCLAQQGQKPIHPHPSTLSHVLVRTLELQQKKIHQILQSSQNLQVLGHAW